MSTDNAIGPETHEAVQILTTQLNKGRRPPHTSYYVSTLVLSQPVFAEQVRCLTGLNCVYDPGNHRYVYRRGQFSDAEMGRKKWRSI